MRSLKWSTSHAVFVPEIDDEHKEIFEALANVQKVLTGDGPVPEIRTLTQRLVSSIVDHFSHEERLMTAARYDAFHWHKLQHDTAAKRVGQFVSRIEKGDVKAGAELVAYLTSWLHDHTRLPDRMLGAFLRNQSRAMFMVTFQASTKPVEGCVWVDANGNAFEPPRGR